MSQTERERRPGKEGRRLSNFILSKREKKKQEQQKWKEGAPRTSSTQPVNITTRWVEKTHKACKGVCIKDMIIQFWLTQLLSHSWTSISSAQTFHSASLHSVRLTIISLFLSNTCAPSHPLHAHARAPLRSWPQHCDLTPSVSYWSLPRSERANQSIWLDYAGKSQGNPSHPLCSFQNMSIQFPQSCLRVASDKNMVK